MANNSTYQSQLPQSGPMGNNNTSSWAMYLDRPLAIPPAMSNLLETYSNIPPDAQESHVITVRNRAYAITPYPCLGRFRFLKLDLASHPLYVSDVLRILTSPPSTFNPAHDPVFLDIGSCLGQDIRKLIHDGAPVSRIYGSDLRWSTIDCGYDLFRDEAKLSRDRFLVPGNILDNSDASALRRVQGKCDVINAIAVFHLFDRPEQIRMAAQMVLLLRRDRGAENRKLLMGQHLGKWEAVQEVRRDRRMFRHDEGTWRALWDEVLKGSECRDIVASWEVGLRVWQIPAYANAQYNWHLWWVWIEFR